MARPRKAVIPAHTVTVKVPDAVADGKGGFYPVGAVIEAADADGLKAKGLAE